MKARFIFTLLIILAILCSTVNLTEATLYVDTALGVAYDSVLDITIPLDADSMDGTLSWVSAQANAGTFEVPGLEAFTGGWRLMRGGDCIGYNCEFPDSEFGHIWYTVLGFNAIIDGHTPGDDCGLVHDEIDPFFDLRSATYWLDERMFNQPMFFNARTGLQSYGDCTYAWYVHDGDIAGIPEPATVVLLGAGILGLAGLRRKRS